MRKKSLVFLLAASVAIGSTALSLTAKASAAVSSLASASISADTAASGSFTALPAIAITENAAGDVGVGTVTIGLPAGFAFDTTANSSVAFTGTGLTGAPTVSYPDSTHFSIQVTASSTAAGSVSIGSATPLKVKATGGSPLASGNMTLTSGTILGIDANTNFGTLTEVPGTATHLSFTVQPPASVNVNTPFGTTVAAMDQFGNVVTTDNGRSVSLSVTAVNPTTTTGSLSGSTSQNTGSGLATFSSLAFSQTGTIALNATASSLLGASSTNISVTATTPTPTTTPPTICNLHNGMLVKVEGSSTVYMVVNCVLRPFNTPAIFHSHGKKFEDVIVISQAQFAQLSVGNPIGEGNDGEDGNKGDDNRIFTMPPIITGTGTGSTTLPNLGNLPDGTLVKIPGNPTVYIVSGGTLKPFTSFVVFQAHKKKEGDIKVISQAELQALPLGSPATFPDGTLLKGSGHTMYIVENGQLFGIANMGVLRKKGLSVKNALKVNDQEISSQPQGGVEN